MTDPRFTDYSGPDAYFSGDPRTNHERMLAGDFYVFEDDPAILAAQQRAAALTGQINETYARDADAAQALVRELLGSMGEGSYVRAPLWVDYGTNLHLGPRTYINFNLTALDVAEIRIGADCQLGPNVQLLTPVHPLDAEPRRDKLEAAQPISIGDNVWLGGAVTVLPGVTIGSDSVIGAGAIVTKDVPTRSLVVGTPGRVIRTL